MQLQWIILLFCLMSFRHTNRPLQSSVLHRMFMTWSFVHERNQIQIGWLFYRTSPVRSKVNPELLFSFFISILLWSLCLCYLFCSNVMQCGLVEQSSVWLHCGLSYPSGNFLFLYLFHSLWLYIPVSIFFFLSSVYNCWFLNNYYLDNFGLHIITDFLSISSPSPYLQFVFLLLQLW